MQIVGKALVLSLCLLSSCRPHIGHIPSMPPVEEEFRDDPARDAQLRLLREAYRAFVQERYQAAALFFRRFADGAPNSPRLAEARWWLGRSQEQLGDYRAAMVQYRLVASGQAQAQYNGTLYEDAALRRLDELRQMYADIPGTARQVALRVRLHQLPAEPNLPTWLGELSQAGITALIIDPVRTEGAGRPIFDFERVKAIITSAHNRGLPVWVSVEIHQPQGLELNPDWMNGTLNRRDGTAVLGPDLANRGYQAYLEEVVNRLARSGCDGLFVPARSKAGFAEEFSDRSFELFKASFGQDLSLQHILATGNVADTVGQERGLMYWRWIGWKALNTARVLARLRTVLRQSRPTAGLLLEVHQVSLSTPLEGLEQYGEDVAELIQRTGGSIVVRRDGQEAAGLIEKLGRQLGTADRLWVQLPVSGGEPPLSAASVGRSVSEMREPRTGHLLLSPEPGAVP